MVLIRMVSLSPFARHLHYLSEYALAHPSSMMRGRFLNTLLLALLFTASAAAQQTPDDAAGGRPCEKTAHAGFNATHGNADTLALLLGADFCREWKGGRWSADLDANLHRTEGSAASERVDLYLFRERHFQRDWVVSFFGTGEVDRARKLDSRLLAGAGVGKLRQFKWRKGGHAGLHAGVAYTMTDEEHGREHGFPEAWSKVDFSAKLTEDLTMNSAFHVFSNLEDAQDVRMDSETNFAIRIHRRISLRTGMTINYDFRPAEQADELDLATHTLLAFSWGEGDQ